MTGTAIDYEHVGCFISCHSPDPCPLGTTMRNADVDADMTPGQCFEYCKQFGLPYFGTEVKIGILMHSAYFG